jgi:golgi pH regulator
MGLAQVFFAVSGGGNTTMLVLILTELLGLYTISSILLIRKQLPMKYRTVITEVLGGDLEFEYFHRWFNGLFLASVILTMLLFYARYQGSLDDMDGPGLPVWNSNSGNFHSHSKR